MVRVVDDFQRQLINAGDKLAVVVLSAGWCSSWNGMLTFVLDQANTYRDDVVFLVVDIDKCNLTAFVRNVSVLPTLVFQKGDHKFETFQGAHETSVKDRIDKYRYASAEPKNTACAADEKDFKSKLDDAEHRSVLVCFCKESCDTCKQNIRIHATDYPDLLFLKVYYEKCPNTTIDYKITSYPTFILRNKTGNSSKLVSDDDSELETFLDEHKDE